MITMNNSHNTFFDTISPLTPPSTSPSESTSLDTPALTHHRSKNEIPYNCGGMFGSYKNFATRLVPRKNSESEVESRSSCVPTPNSTTSYNSMNILIDNLAGKQNFNEALLPPCSTSSRAKRALDSRLRDQEFTRDEAKKIMANEKLGEIALADPKRVKRILANRQSAARSKEKRMRYVMELEHKMHILQRENTALSAQLSLLQREATGLVNRNNELRIRLEALIQQSQLQNVLNEALKAELQHLKIDARELLHDLAVNLLENKSMAFNYHKSN